MPRRKRCKLPAPGPKPERKKRAPRGKLNFRPRGLSLAPLVQRAADAGGGPTRLAAALGLKRENIYRWTRVPEKYLDQVVQRTGIPGQELRPDLYNDAGERLL